MRARDKSSYLPIYYLEPAGPNRRALGFELDSNSLRRQALDHARDTGQAIATAPMHLLQGVNGRYGFVVYLPLLDPALPSADGKKQSLRGYASAVFWIDDLLGGCVSDLGKQGLAAQIVDSAAGPAAIYTQSAQGSPCSGLDGSASLEIAGRHWTLTLSPTTRFVASRTSANATLLLAASLLITLLLGFCFYGGVVYTARIEQRVILRTAELSRQVSERNARRKPLAWPRRNTAVFSKIPSKGYFRPA